MKYTTALAVLAAAGAQADINSVLSSVGDAIQSLQKAAEAFNGDVSGVESKAEALVSTIKSGISTVNASPQLSIEDAAGLVQSVGTLNTEGQDLESTFKSKRSDIEKIGACDTVRSQLADINDASQQLIKAVTAKVPTALQPTAAGLAGKLTTTLNQAQTDFDTSNCVNAKGAASSAAQSSGAAQTSAAQSSAAESSAAQTSAAATGSASAAPTTMVASTTAATGTNGTATGPASSVPTAGAAFLAPAGALVMAVAAALL